MRMIIRVHNRTADRRADTHVSLTACFTDFNILMVDVAYLTDGRHAGVRDVSQLAGGQSEQRHAVFLRHQLSHVAGCSCELSAAAGIKLNVVYESTGGDVDEGQRVAGLDIRGGAGDNLIADLQALRRDDVRLLAVGVLYQSDKRRCRRLCDEL